jgi:septin family protein
MKKFAEISPTDMLEMNKTNRYSWGKIMVNVKRISDFPFMGNIFIRITLAPWQVKTKNLLH